MQERTHFHFSLTQFHLYLEPPLLLTSQNNFNRITPKVSQSFHTKCGQFRVGSLHLPPRVSLSSVWYAEHSVAEAIFCPAPNWSLAVRRNPIGTSDQSEDFASPLLIGLYTLYFPLSNLEPPLASPMLSQAYFQFSFSGLPSP